MKKALIFFIFTCFIIMGCSESTSKTDPTEMTQDELNELTEEEVNALNQPPNGEPINVGESLDIEGFHVEVNHYYHLPNGIYSKTRSGTVRNIAPMSSDEGYVIINVKVTNNTGEETVYSPVHFNILTNNGEKRTAGVLAPIHDPYINGSNIMPGGYKEGNVVGIAPKGAKDLKLHISFRDSEITKEVVLPNE